MASNSVLKAARSSEVPETDPLAELSRIMGLAKEEAVANSSETDFELDLEQELMGEFLRDDAEPQPQARAPQVAEEEVGSLEADFDDAFADMLAETVETQEPEAGQAAEPASVRIVEEQEVDLKAREAAIEDDLADLDAAFEGLDLAVADEHAPEQADEELEEALFDDPSVFAEVEEPSLEAETSDEIPTLAEFPPAVVDGDLPAALNASDVGSPASPPAASIEDELRALLGQIDVVDVPYVDAAEAAVEGDFAEPSPEVMEQVAEPAAASASQALSDVELEFSEDDFLVEQPEPSHDETTGQSDADAAEDVVAQAEEELASEMPSFDDFTFDEADFDTAGLTAAVAEDDGPHASEEPDVTPPVATWTEAALNPLERPEAISETQDDMAIDLEAELATFSDEANEPAISAEGEKPAPDPVGLRPLTFAGERAAAPERPAAPAFDWRKRYAEMKSTEPARSAPVAEQASPTTTEPTAGDADPFAALAALAAQPPILRSLGRGNPVAVGPEAAERAPAPQAASAAPAVERSTVSASSMPAFSSWRTQNLQGDSAPRAPVAPKPAAPEPVIPQRGGTGQTGPLFPVSRSDTSFQPLRPEPAASMGAAPASSFFAARPSTPPPEPTVSARVAPRPADDDFPDLDALLDDANLAPDIDTVEFSDDAVALADDLDIPEFVADEPAAASSPFDDLDADFASAFQQLSAAPAPKATQPAYRPDTGAAYYVERDAAAARDAYSPRPTAQSTLNAQEPSYDEQLAGFDADQGSASYADDDDVAFAGDFYGVEAEKDQPKRNRGLLIGALLAVVAVIGGIGAYALTGGSGGDNAPALVKADPSPVKVKPETPGGVVVPNQDGQVYDQVRGQPAAAPSQDKLVSGAEEPIAAPAPTPAPVAAEPAAAEPPVVAAPAAAALPGVETPQVKSEERVTPEDSAQTAPQSQDVAAIVPKKVRTMIVRPDGTLVAREDPPAASAETTGTTTATMPTTADPATMVATQADAPVPSAVPGARDDVSILPAETSEESASGLETPAPADVIVPMPRPSRAATSATEEPVRQATATPAPVRSEPAPQPAASAVQEASAPAAAAASLWTVQIASQPTREGAQSSYEDLARRYGSVLGGKGVNIIQAEVAGKGTMWRVRVPAASKNDANILCAKLKTAGGSCFVTQ